MILILNDNPTPGPKADSLVNTVAESILAEMTEQKNGDKNCVSPDKTDTDSAKSIEESWKSSTASFKLIQAIEPQKTILPKLDLYTRNAGLNGGLSSLINGNALVKPSKQSTIAT